MDKDAGGTDRETSAVRQIEFSNIPAEAEAWRKVLHLGNRLKFPKGTELALSGGREGHPAGCLYFLERGEVRLIRATLDGREKILITMRAGSIVGETPFFDEVPPRSTTVAVTDCVVYAFTRDCVLRRIIPCYPDLTLALLKSFAAKVRALCNQSVSLSLEDLPARICRFLRLRALKNAEGGLSPRVVPGLNQQDLANLLGVHRVTLNKSLRELEKEGVLGPYARDEVYILDMERFLELAPK